MQRFGRLLCLLGIVSCVIHFMNLELRVLAWIDTWGQGPAWGIRAGFVVVGLLLMFAGKPKPAQ